MNKPTFTIQDSMQRKIKYENYKFIFENNIYVSLWQFAFETGLYKKFNNDFNYDVTFQTPLINHNYSIIEKKKVNTEFLKSNLENWLNIFTTDLKILNITNSIKSRTKSLKDFATVSQGLIPYDKYRGHSEETIKNRY